MRLLTREADGSYALHTFYKDPPVYVILSHRWEAEEPTYQDIVNKVTPINTPGWRKLMYCADYTDALDLSYFWVDTVCIDKTSSAELTEAINSMFRWYADSYLCIVYLSDVHTNVPTTSLDEFLKEVENDREADETIGDLIFHKIGFQKSAWFTRGWTLQELLAPTDVLFFSSSFSILGNRRSLERQIVEATALPIEVLRGKALDKFSKETRLSWAAKRETTRDEDRAYCLMGIFDITMPVIYGEGETRALRRLEAEIKTYHEHVVDSSPPRATDGGMRSPIPAHPIAAHFVRELTTNPMPARLGDKPYASRKPVQARDRPPTTKPATTRLSRADPAQESAKKNRKNCFGLVVKTGTYLSRKYRCGKCGWKRANSTYDKHWLGWPNAWDGIDGKVESWFHASGSHSIHGYEYEAWRCFLCNLKFPGIPMTKSDVRDLNTFELLQRHLIRTHTWSEVQTEYGKFQDLNTEVD